MHVEERKGDDRRVSDGGAVGMLWHLLSLCESHSQTPMVLGFEVVPQHSSHIHGWCFRTLFAMSPYMSFLLLNSGLNSVPSKDYSCVHGVNAPLSFMNSPCKSSNTQHTVHFCIAI